jgi:hypothetical protein
MTDSGRRWPCSKVTADPEVHVEVRAVDIVGCFGVAYCKML